MFTKKLRLLRLEKGYTQAQLGKRLGICASAVGMYEQGRREPDREMLLRICAVFSVSADYLLDEKAPRSGKDSLDLEEMISDINEVLLSQKMLVFRGRPVDKTEVRHILAAMSAGARRSGSL